MQDPLNVCNARGRVNIQQIAVGLCIVLLGTFLVLDRLGILSAQHTLRYWPIGLILIGLSVILQALVGDGKARSTVPWGAIFWLVVLGFGLTHVFDRQGDASETGSNMSLFAVLGGTNRAAEPDFKSASITTMMGGGSGSGGVSTTATPPPGPRRPHVRGRA